MELTRLRRFLREANSPSLQDAQAVLDAVDSVREDAETYEDELRQSSTPEEEDLADFVQRHGSSLIQALMGINAVGVEGVLKVLVESESYEKLIDTLEIWKKESEKAKQLEDALLGDLDDHPF